MRIGLWAAWRKRACCSAEETFAEQQCLSALYAPSVLAGLGSADPPALKRAAEWANRSATTAPSGRYGWQEQSSITRPRPLRSRISKRAPPRWRRRWPQSGQAADENRSEEHTSELQ